jgi:hypothetical protein
MSKLPTILRTILIALPILFIFSCKDPVPTILFTTPQDKQKYFKDEEISIKVILADTKDKVFDVQLFVDGILFGEASNSPYYFTIEAGVVLPGKHTIKVTAGGVEALRTITVKEANSESDDFVTFTGGIIPPEWTVNNWAISTTSGWDDNFSLFTMSPKAQVTTAKKCNKISFYLRGNGTINLYMDGKLFEEIQMNDSSKYNIDWRLYEFSCPRTYHTFIWELAEGILPSANLDAILFETIEP